MTKIEDYAFPDGLRLLTRWQAGDEEAKQKMTDIFDAAIAGEFDENFSILAQPDRVNSTASVHMLTLALLNDLYGIETWDYYNTDPYRYVRSNLAVGRLLGVRKFYLTWAVYAVTCEPLGQKMMYPDKFPPGADPDVPLINRENWHLLETPDYRSGAPKIIEDILRVNQELTGLPPLLQLSAPYSLAADIYGQEPLLADVVNDPDNVNALLDHLGEKVIGPWMDHHMETFADGWIELSDASGSPFFIGPENCKKISIRSIRQLLRDKPYRRRVFDNNYRGDFVAEVKKKTRSSRRKAAQDTSTDKVGLLELTEAKVGVNPVFIMRLEADKVDISFYEEQAIQRNLPLTSGIGSPQIDRNSIEDLDGAKVEIANESRAFVEAIRHVCETIDLPEDNHVGAPWPSHIYFEDVNGQSEFELVEIILNEVNNSAPIRRPSGQAS